MHGNIQPVRHPVRLPRIKIPRATTYFATQTIPVFAVNLYSTMGAGLFFRELPNVTDVAYRDNTSLRPFWSSKIKERTKAKMNTQKLKSALEQHLNDHVFKNVRVSYNGKSVKGKVSITQKNGQLFLEIGNKYGSKEIPLYDLTPDVTPSEGHTILFGNFGAIVPIAPATNTFLRDHLYELQDQTNYFSSQIAYDTWYYTNGYSPKSGYSPQNCKSREISKKTIYTACKTEGGAIVKFETHFK